MIADRSRAEAALAAAAHADCLADWAARPPDSAITAHSVDAHARTAATRLDWLLAHPAKARALAAALVPVPPVTPPRPSPMPLPGVDDKGWEDVRQARVAPASMAPDPTLEALRPLSEAASDGPWQWLDGDDGEGDELQDGHGEMVATGFRENLVFDGEPLNRDGSFAAAAVNYVRERLEARRYVFSTGGWSGNESIVAAIEANQMLQVIGAWSWRRGGHYEYRFPVGEGAK